MKSICFSDCEEGGRIKFVRAKMRSVNGKELNMLVILAVDNAIKMNRKYKVRALDKYKSDNESDHLSFGDQYWNRLRLTMIE